MYTKAFIIGCFALLSTHAGANTLPALHTTGEHHRALLLTPPSEQPVVIKVMNAQQQVILHWTLNAADGIEKGINFSWMPTGDYYVEVHYEGRSFYKAVAVQNDRVRAQDTSTQFQTTLRFQL